MTILDALLSFDPQGTLITVTAPSINVLDMAQQRDMGEGSPEVDLFCIVQTAFVAAGAATLQVAIQGAVDNGSGAPGTYFNFAITDAIAKAQLIVGQELLRMAQPARQPAVSGVQTPPRFYRLNYTVATGPFTAGAIFSSWIDRKGRQSNYAYPSGFTVAN